MIGRSIFGDSKIVINKSVLLFSLVTKDFAKNYTHIKPPKSTLMTPYDVQGMEFRLSKVEKDN